MVNEYVSILKFLVGNQESKYSIRQLSKIRKVNYKTAYQAIMKLHKEGVVSLEKLGNTINCSFNKKFDHLVYQAEDERRKDLLNNKDFKVILEHLKLLKNPSIVLLFGSYIKETQTKKSDIDLLVITNNEDEFEHEMSILPMIHYTIITYEEFNQMLKSKEASVVSEALKKNIILNGIEDYYRVISNA